MLHILYNVYHVYTVYSTVDIYIHAKNILYILRKLRPQFKEKKKKQIINSIVYFFTS